MKEKRDNIYIYLWEELNTVYIGRTVNPKGRHYAHKHRETEKTYQFSSEHHVEHPKMIIIENDLTIEEGVEREKYWIDYYRNNTPYNILNKTNGGEIGGQLSTLTEDEKKERKKIYNNTHKKERAAYYKEYYRKRNADKILLKTKKKEEKKFLEIQKKILKNEEKIRKLVYEFKNKSYYESHKEQVKKYKNKSYYESHKEQVKKYYEENKEKINNRMKKYYKKNKEKIYEKQKEYYELNKEKICARKRKYYETHKRNLDF